MNHRAGAGERRRRRRSLTMNELPVSWLPPESISIPSNPLGAGTISVGIDARKKYGSSGDGGTLHSSSSYPQWTSIASTETDVWALGIACIELFQGTAPKRGTPILSMFEESTLAGQGTTGNIINGFSAPMAMTGGTVGSSMNGWGNFQIGMYSGARMGMSVEMWSFIARCLTSDPAARPKVHELLKVRIGADYQHSERCTAANHTYSL